MNIFPERLCSRYLVWDLILSYACDIDKAGFSSFTATHFAARSALEFEVPTELAVLLLGDAANIVPSAKKSVSKELLLYKAGDI